MYFCAIVMLDQPISFRMVKGSNPPGTASAIWSSVRSMSVSGDDVPDVSPAASAVHSLGDGSRSSLKACRVCRQPSATFRRRS